MRMVQGIFARYGTRAVLNGRPVSVFLKTTRRSTQENYTPLGLSPQGQYVCCLAAEVMPQVGDSLRVDGEGYELIDVQAMKLGNCNLYWRATARKKGGADTWGI